MWTWKASKLIKLEIFCRLLFCPNISEKMSVYDTIHLKRMTITPSEVDGAFENEYEDGRLNVGVGWWS